MYFVTKYILLRNLFILSSILGAKIQILVTLKDLSKLWRESVQLESGRRKSVQRECVRGGSVRFRSKSKTVGNLRSNLFWVTVHTTVFEMPAKIVSHLKFEFNFEFWPQK